MKALWVKPLFPKISVLLMVIRTYRRIASHRLCFQGLDSGYHYGNNVKSTAVSLVCSFEPCSVYESFAYCPVLQPSVCEWHTHYMLSRSSVLLEVTLNAK